MDKKPFLNGEIIISLLHELDDLANEPCRIIICGGACAIVAHGLNRLTGDIDIFEPIPKTHDFYKHLKKIEEEHGFDSAWFNEGAKGFSDCLNPNYKKRLIPIDKDFKNLSVFAISKADLITMKLCAWREPDREDIISLGIKNEEMKIIKENVTYMQNNRPGSAEKALRAMTELGLIKSEPLKADYVSNLAELIQFYKEQTGKEASIEEIRQWKNRESYNLSFSSVARSFVKGKDFNKGMDI